MKNNISLTSPDDSYKTEVRNKKSEIYISILKLYSVICHPKNLTTYLVDYGERANLLRDLYNGKKILMIFEP